MLHNNVLSLQSIHMYFYLHNDLRKVNIKNVDFITVEDGQLQWQTKPI